MVSTLNHFRRKVDQIKLSPTDSEGDNDNTRDSVSLGPCTPRPSSPADEIDHTLFSWSQGHTPPQYRSLTQHEDGESDVPQPESQRWSQGNETRLHNELQGPRFARGRPSGLCPLLERFAEMFSPAHFVSLIDQATSVEERAMRAFRSACQNAGDSVRMEGTRATAVDREQHGLIGITAIAMLALAKALAARDLGARRQRIHELRELVECMFVLVELEEELLQDIVE